MSTVSIRPEHKSVVAPAELCELPAWLIWRYETFPGENKPRKVPYYASGGKRYGHQGSDRDRQSLTTFALARDAAAKRGFDGVGFAPLAEFGITALDFDKCVGPNGELPDEVRAVVARTASEFSPSGTGIRAFVKGNLHNHKSPATSEQFGFETFASSGFVTVTGHLHPVTELLGLEDTIAPVDADLEALCRKRFGDQRPAAGADGDDPFAGTEKPIGLTIDRMTELLGQIDPDMSREDWIRVGMALHFECQGDDTGFELWDEWSAQGGKYPSREALQAQWESFSRPRAAGRRPVTMASVMRMAKRATAEAPGQRAASAEELGAKMAETPAGDPRGLVTTPEDFSGKYPVLSAKAMSLRPPGKWLIKGVIPRADIVVLFGASGSGKSFIGMDMAAAIAQGIEWRGRKTTKGRVLIIAAEGGGGVGKRLKAYAQHYQLDLDQLDIGVIVAAPNFLHKDEIGEVVASVRASGGVDLIITDTFAQVTPGANENAGEDMGLAMANAKALGEAVGAVVLLVHHAGKDTTRGSRGWSGIKAAADAELEVIHYENGGRELRISKMKDGEDGLQWGFKLEVVTVGRDDDGDDVTSCVALEAEVPLPPADDSPRQNVKSYDPIETHMLDVADSLIDTAKMPTQAFINKCAESLPVEDGKADRRQGALFAALRRLSSGRNARFGVRHGLVEFL